jgi:methylase of polypeptide subunit release factors
LQTEQDRLDIIHHVNLLMLGGNLLTAPIPKDPQMILDIGTGTGIWAIDAGEKYPSAKVIGTDLSPIQPNWYD